MTEFFSHPIRGLLIVNLITTKLPGYLADGKITVDEMVDFIKSVLDVGGWSASIDLPDDLKGKSATFTLNH